MVEDNPLDLENIKEEGQDEDDKLMQSTVKIKLLTVARQLMMFKAYYATLNHVTMQPIRE